MIIDAHWGAWNFCQLGSWSFIVSLPPCSPPFSQWGDTVKAIIIFDVKDTEEFKKIKEASKLPDEKWYLLRNRDDILYIINKLFDIIDKGEGI